MSMDIHLRYIDSFFGGQLWLSGLSLCYCTQNVASSNPVSARLQVLLEVSTIISGINI